MNPTQSGQKQPAAKADAAEIINPSTNPDESTSNATPAISTDGAVGVEESHWFVGWVTPRSEKKVRDNMLSDNIEAYAAVRNELHTWRRNEKRIVKSVLIPCIVFVKTQKSMLEQLRKRYNLLSFMRDPARTQEGSRNPFAIISEAEMKALQSMVSQEEYEVAFENTQFTLGEHVQVVGLKYFSEMAQIVKLPGKKETFVGVRIGFLGCAYMKVPIDKVVKIKKQNRPPMIPRRGRE